MRRQNSSSGRGAGKEEGAQEPSKPIEKRGKEQFARLSQIREADLAALQRDDGHDAASSVMDAKRQLEKLQVQTIFSLVEQVEVHSRPCKLLFLSNKQASDLDVQMEKFIQAMDISPRPSLVINLITSFYGNHRVFGARMEKHWSQVDTETETTLLGEAEGKEGLERLEQRIARFLQQCVLPVAIQTNAIIFTAGPNLCVLQSVFAQLCKSEAAKTGGVLPFTVINICPAENLIYAARTPGTVSHELFMSSKRWRSSSQMIAEAARPVRGLFESGHLPRETDLPKGCTHYIVIDSVTVNDRTGDPVVDWFQSRWLLNQLVQTFGAALPSIAFSTMNWWWTIGAAPFYSAYVGQGLPFVLIDSRPQTEGGAPQTVAEAIAGLDALEESLNSEGQMNTYSASTLAYLHSSLRRELHTSRSRHGGADSTKGAPLSKAIGLMAARERHDDDAMASTSDAKAAGARANFLDEQSRLIDQICRYTSNLGKRQESTYPKIAHAAEAQRLDRFMSGAKSAKGAAGLDRYLKSTSASWCGVNGYQERTQKLVDKYDDLFAACLWPDHDSGECGQEDDDRGSWGIVLGLGQGLLLATDGSWSSEDLHSRVIDALAAEVQLWLAELTYPKPSGFSKEPGISDTELYVALTDFLSADMTFSVNLDDRTQLSRVINKVARIDRLPQENSLPAMQILQRAWECVDIYTHVARRCKRLAKCIYALMLINGMAITILTTLWLNAGECEDEEDSSAVAVAVVLGTGDEACWEPAIPLRTLVVVLTLVGTTLSSVLAFVNPTAKWHQLRAAALALESEIWKFRTRSGAYALSSGLGMGSSAASNGRGSRAPELMLRAMTEELSSHVLKSASVGTSAFFARFDNLFGETRHAALYKHGQHQRSLVTGTYGTSGADDDHHSPLTPALYLELRVKPQLRFYQRRLPSYSHARAIFETVSISSAVASTVLAFAGYSTYTAVPTAVMTACTAYAKFVAPDTKLQRYSDTIAGIDRVLLGWRSLTDVEQANVANVSELVADCEDLFSAERQAWVSTAMANSKAMLQADEDAKPKEASSDKEKSGSILK